MPGTIDETIALIENAGGSAFGLTADLEDAEARDGLVDAVLDRTGRIDILVNNAGFADYALIEDMSLETFDRTVEHYLRTPFVLTKAAVPHMRKQGGGWIVNIGSVTGVAPVRPYRDYNKTSGDVIYASCKAALHRFTQGVAAELLDANIAVNCVGPVDGRPHAWCGVADSGHRSRPNRSSTWPRPCWRCATCLPPNAPAWWRSACTIRGRSSYRCTASTVRPVLPPLEPPATANPNILPAGL